MLKHLARTKNRARNLLGLCSVLALTIVMLTYMSSLVITTRLMVSRDSGGISNALIAQDVDWPPKLFFQGNNATRFVITITNYDYVDFADNFAQSLLRQRVFNFLIVPTDERAHGLLQPIYPRHVLPVPPGVTKSYRRVRNFGSKAFRDLTALRPIILRQLLAATNASLLYNDVDMVWRQNAWDAVDMHKESDVILWHDGSQQLCSCILYLQPSDKSYELLDKWSREIETGHYRNDQPALNNALKLLNNNSWSTIRDYERFPHGSYFFGRLAAPIAPRHPDFAQRRSKAVIVHNNWANNKTVKTERFRQHGLWNLSTAMELHIKNERLS